MSTLRIVLGDQLSRDIAALRDADPARDRVLMMEVAEETTYVPHHRQKIVFFLSAMRHFAAELQAAGFTVDYIRLDDPANTGSFGGEAMRAVRRHDPDRVIVTVPGEHRVVEAVRGWQAATGVPVEVRDDDRFFCSVAGFRDWAAGRKSLRMEHFYRVMRRRTGILMDGDGEPVGGRWNFDADNRRRMPKSVKTPAAFAAEPDAVTREVIDLVEQRFPDGFGDLRPFRWAVTRHGALQALQRFVTERLQGFGDYQDAMRAGEAFAFHSVVSPYLNAGLLSPAEVCAAAEAAWKAGKAPINAVEGFIRQILGWREYVRGIYWTNMPGYMDRNALDADRPLPDFYWTGETEMRCMAEVIGMTRRHAYSHHIQRLMVTGTYALLAGVRPAEISEWYRAVYADALEWVEAPNTLGMSQYADGGLMASKPYAASGAYIDRMSDFCGGCRYDVKQKTGPDACPFNRLYWNFLIRNEKRLRTNPRMAMPYRHIDNMSADMRRELAKARD